MVRLKEIDVDAELARFEAEERKRLGLETARSHWTDSMIDPQFKKSDRPHTTILVSGLTMAHDYLIEGALRGQGYQVRSLDSADNESLRFGKEFGNKSQCNPTYFTVGNLVKELCRLRDKESLSADEVIKKYVFLTAGACGPCRFGMYVTEYRKALRDAGFDGFRVMLFQQTGGLRQATGEEELGLDLRPPFFIALAKALFAGDVINAVAYRLRPYEVEAGATDRAIQAVKDEVYRALSEQKSVIMALRRGRKILEGVELDRTRAKPKVAILGEFWAMTTEGDGNYRLQRFLEAEGAECDIQIIANTLLYNLWEGRHDTLNRAELRGTDGGNYGLEGSDVGLKMAGLWLGEFALRSIFRIFANSVGLYGYHLPDMDEVANVGHSHYNNELRGGEGHMEVAKLILNVAKQKAHMTVSVKPFGCMPSSGVSDGVQSVVTALYPEAIFCPVETSGDGAVNFYSRIQMFLFKARQRAEEEMTVALKEHGVSREEAMAFLTKSRYGRPLFHPPHRVAGSGADLIHHIGPLVGKGPLDRSKVHAKRAYERAHDFLQSDISRAIQVARKAGPYAPALLRCAFTEARSSLPALRKGCNRVLRNVAKLKKSTHDSAPAGDHGRFSKHLRTVAEAALNHEHTKAPDSAVTSRKTPHTKVELSVVHAP